MKRIAAIVTEYRPLSHADVLLGKFLDGFPTDDGLRSPRVEVASIYLDQVNATDTGVAIARDHGVPIYPSVLRALTLGGDDLAVDAVLLIGEHGEYPLNEKGQKLYPRRHLFEQIAGVISTSGRSVPVFCDKHLSYNWSDAHWMYRRARDLQLPFMAGSSLPVCWRSPNLEHPLGANIRAAVSIGYGPIESYGFHALETLQCMVERRGTQNGVASVRCLEGDEVWTWLAGHPQHAELAAGAAGAIGKTEGSWGSARDLVQEPAAFLLSYRDGLQGLVLMLNGFCRSFAYAGLVDDAVQSCEFVLQTGGSHAHFSYLGLNVEEMFVTGRPSYPVERTLLTTGILAAAMDSRALGGTVVPTPQLDVVYAPVDSVPYRPTGSHPLTP